MNSDSAHKNRWQIGEVVFGIPFLVSIAMHYVIPIPLSHGAFARVLIPAGVTLIIAGLGLIVLARREFARYGQPTDPGLPTAKIVKTGVFAISRNPLYLGAVIFVLGIALILNELGAIGMLLISIIICHYVLIIPEEQYLATKFGDEYNEYVTTVNRWFGRK